MTEILPQRRTLMCEYDQKFTYKINITTTTNNNKNNILMIFKHVLFNDFDSMLLSSLSFIIFRGNFFPSKNDEFCFIAIQKYTVF